MLTIVLSGLILFSSIILGLTARLIIRRHLWAIAAAFFVRGLLVFNEIPSLVSPDFLKTTWLQKPLTTIADTGVSSLLVLANPGRYWIVGGSNAPSIALLPITLVMDMLLIYIMLSLAIVHHQNKTRQRAGEVGRARETALQAGN
jgi:hypothetical protein